MKQYRELLFYPRWKRTLFNKGLYKRFAIQEIEKILNQISFSCVKDEIWAIKKFNELK